ncbi:Aspartyl beta-hydroxylase [Pseudomonas sp. 8Z]|uniref:sulfotransferase n=1 Tax=Pseudomonas sp. 8Z TaxID=2653166 RepID=UPI0012F32342|nr:sulfotransferase [Pseudomonas sp. 8Z]VXC17819.1 Aspartyl beta-hydroxylase [Pseudomonas sp. 8Z]
MAHITPEHDFTGWLPIRINPTRDGWRVDWCWFGQQRLTLPFFRDDVNQALRLPFNQALRRETDLDALRQWHTTSPGLPPAALIFHASRCGSTLMAQMLAALPSNIVLSEPPPLDSLLRAHRHDPSMVTHQARDVAALLSAYGQSRQGDEQRLFVKLDTWNIFEAPLLAELYPDIPRIFLYRDPLEIAVSHMHQAGMQCVPGLLGASGLEASSDNQTYLSQATFISRVIARTLEAGLSFCQHHGGIPVNYSELPDALWGRLAAIFDISDTNTLPLRDTAHRDAKQPAMTFKADSAKKRLAATDELRASITEWAQKPYRRLEALRLAGLQTE